MAYAVKTDVEARFGVDNVASWSNLDNDDAATSDARVDTAISVAEARINDRFRKSRYSVPLQSGGGAVPAVVTDWAATLAGVWLQMSRSMLQDNVESPGWKRVLATVNAEIDQYLAGTRDLDASLEQESITPTAPSVIDMDD